MKLYFFMIMLAATWRTGSCWLLHGEQVLEVRVTAGRSLRSYCSHIWVRDEGGSALATLEVERSGHTWGMFWRHSRQDSLMRLTWHSGMGRIKNASQIFGLRHNQVVTSLFEMADPGERTDLEG